MYTGFYELSQEPFHVTPDPEFLFPSPSHKEALAAIVYGIEQRKGFVAVTGEVGVGKTTILRSYLDLADRKNLKLIYIYNSNLTFDELITTLFQELGIEDRPPTTFLAVTRLHEELIEIYRKNQTVVLIIDEAQNMPVETLENLRMLSNLETVTEKLIQIMLIGQSEFDEMLQQHRLRQLRQRIAIHARIGPLTVEDSIAYLEHRLSKVALGPKPVFTKQALSMIAEAAQGIPRTLNILSDNALITGFGYQVRPVNAKIVKEVLADRRIAPESPPVRGAWIAAGAAAAVVVAALSIVLLQPRLFGGDLQIAHSEAAAKVPAESPGHLERAVDSVRRWVGQVLGDDPPPERNAPTTAMPAPVPKGSDVMPTEPPPRQTAEAMQQKGPGLSPSPSGHAPKPQPKTPPPAPRTDEALPVPPSPAAAARSPKGEAASDLMASGEVQSVAPSPERSGAAEPATDERASAPKEARVPQEPAPDSSPSDTPAARAPQTAKPAAPRAVPEQLGPASPQIASRPAPSPSAPLPPPASSPPPSLANAPSDTPPQTSPAPPAQGGHLIRTVRYGDSLWTMAEDVYGYVNPNVLRRVQDANPHVRNINWLNPGQEIAFPRDPEGRPERPTFTFQSAPTPLPPISRN